MVQVQVSNITNYKYLLIYVTNSGGNKNTGSSLVPVSIFKATVDTEVNVYVNNSQRTGVVRYISDTTLGISSSYAGCAVEVFGIK